MSYAAAFPDVSSYQGAVSIRAYAAAARTTALLPCIGIKATEGRTIKDSQFARTWKLAAYWKLGLRIPYAFAHPENNAPEVEAREFLRTVFAAGARSTDWPCLDFESVAAAKMGQAKLREWIEDFCRFVVLHWGRGPMIYSGGWYWRPNVGDGYWPRSGYGYWHSAYAEGLPNIPREAAKHVVLHQFSDGIYGPRPHGAPGIATRCDMNRIARRGGLKEVARLARGGYAYRVRFVAHRANWKRELA